MLKFHSDFFKLKKKHLHFFSNDWWLMNGEALNFTAWQIKTSASYCRTK